MALRRVPHPCVPVLTALVAVAVCAAILRADGVDGLIAALNRKADILTGTMAKAY